VYDAPTCTYDAATGLSKFTGKERDSETGLDYFGARYYGSNMGRFMSPDEFTGGPVSAFGGDPTPPGSLPYADITNPQSLNKFAYAFNNPLRYIDSDGHSSLEYDAKKKTLTLYSNDGKKLGSWRASNNVERRLKIGKLPDGTYSFQDKSKAHMHGQEVGKGGIQKDAPNGEYGKNGIFRLDPFKGPDKKPNGDLADHSGVGVHAGREGMTDGAGRTGADFATQGCIRTTAEAMDTISGTAKSDPLTNLTITGNRADGRVVQGGREVQKEDE
jgi:RHS repeat-associated protein